LAQFLTPHILGHTWFKPPGIMLKNDSNFPQSLKEMPGEINDWPQSHFLILAYSKFMISSPSCLVIYTQQRKETKER